MNIVRAGLRGLGTAGLVLLTVGALTLLYQAHIIGDLGFLHRKAESVLLILTGLVLALAGFGFMPRQNDGLS